MSSLIVIIIAIFILALILFSTIKQLKYPPQTQGKNNSPLSAKMHPANEFEQARTEFTALMYKILSQANAPIIAVQKANRLQETGTKMFGLLKSCPELYKEYRFFIKEILVSLKFIYEKTKNFTSSDHWSVSITDSICETYDRIKEILTKIADRANDAIKESIDMEKKVIEAIDKN